MKQIFSLICALCVVLSANAIDFKKSTSMVKSNGLEKKMGVINANPSHKVAKVVAAETIEIEVESATVTDATEEGWFQICGETEEYPGIFICVNAESLEGTWENADMDLEYTALYLDQETSIEIASASGTTSVDGDIMSFDFTLVDADGQEYHVFGNLNAAALAYDAERDINTTFSVNDTITWDDTNFEEYGIMALIVDKAEWAEELYIWFLVDSEEAEVPAGEYEINDSWEAPSVASSTGYSSSFGPTPSCYLTVEEGYIDEMWFLVSGTITVSEESVVVEAVNSLGYEVNITVNLPQTPVDNVNAADVKANKVIRDGQLILKANNREFNAIGAQL